MSGQNVVLKSHRQVFVSHQKFHKDIFEKDDITLHNLGLFRKANPMHDNKNELPIVDVILSILKVTDIQ